MNLAGLKSWVKDSFGSNSYNHLMVPRHYGEAIAANLKFGFPAKHMRVIGVTGTNGKTTTCNMLASVFMASGSKVGLISTATLQFGAELQPNDTHLTSANGWKLQKMLKTMKDAGCDTVILEVSSHALAQGRVWGIPFDVGVLTNITPDHLDYHGTMEAYVDAKSKLFKKAKKLSVLNADDSHSAHLKKIAGSSHVKMYGKERHADLHLVDSSLTPKGANFKVSTGSVTSNFHINQTGLFNVYNAMATLVVARFYNLQDDVIQKGFFNLKNVPGRTELIDEGQDFTVVVDHAHTVDALDKLFDEMKKIAPGRLLILVSGDGDRDPQRRKPIGRLSAEVGDFLVLSEMEDHTEESEHIRAMIRDGIMSVPAEKRARWVEVVDRREAIAKLLKEAKSGDVVVIWGMGNQPYRVMNDGEHPWDEREVVREELKEVLKAK